MTKRFLTDTLINGDLTVTGVLDAPVITELFSDISDVASDLDDHITDSTGAHAAAAISYDPSGGHNLTIEDDVQEAISALDYYVGSTQAALGSHIVDATAAHAASAISFAGATGISATNVEGAIDELAAEKVNKAGDTMTGDLYVGGIIGATGSVIDQTVQVGATNDVNLIMGNNEIIVRDNGAPSTLYLNNDGGAVTLGGVQHWPPTANVTTATPESGWSITVNQARLYGGLVLLRGVVERTGSALAAAAADMALATLDVPAGNLNLQQAVNVLDVAGGLSVSDSVQIRLAYNPNDRVLTLKSRGAIPTGGTIFFSGLVAHSTA